MRRTHFIKRAVAAIVILALFMTILRMTRTPPTLLEAPVSTEKNPQIIEVAELSNNLREKIAHKDLMDAVAETTIDPVAAAQPPKDAPKQPKDAAKDAAKDAPKAPVKADEAAPAAPAAAADEKTPEQLEQEAIAEGKHMYDAIALQPDVAPVIIFSKSYCPHSKRAKSLLLEEHQITPSPLVVELDVLEGGANLQKYLRQLTGRGTVPNVMVNGVSRGGASDLVELGDTLPAAFAGWSQNKFTIKKTPQE